MLPPSDLSQIVLCGGAGGSPARLCDKPLRSKELLVTSWCSVQLETTARSPFRTLNQRVQGSSPCAPTIEINDVAQHTRLATTHLQFGLQLCWRFERADGVNRHRRIEKPVHAIHAISRRPRGRRYGGRRSRCVRRGSRGPFPAPRQAARPPQSHSWSSPKPMQLSATYVAYASGARAMRMRGALCLRGSRAQAPAT